MPLLLDAPRYLHDCDKCTYLGQREEFDLYHCLQGSFHKPTVIARWDDREECYHSGMEVGRAGHEPLATAYRLAHQEGLALK